MLIKFLFCSVLLQKQPTTISVIGELLKGRDTEHNYRNSLILNSTYRFNNTVMHSKDAEGIANNVDPDQTAPLGAVRSGFALLALTFLS